MMSVTSAVLPVGMPRYWTTRSSTTPAHCSLDKLVILAASNVPAVPSHTALPLGSRSTSANVLSPLGRSRTDRKRSYFVGWLIQPGRQYTIWTLVMLLHATRAQTRRDTFVMCVQDTMSWCVYRTQCRLLVTPWYGKMSLKIVGLSNNNIPQRWWM